MTLAEDIELEESDSVLDVSCGRGYFYDSSCEVFKLHNRFGTNAHITFGEDISPARVLKNQPHLMTLFSDFEAYAFIYFVDPYYVIWL